MQIHLKQDYQDRVLGIWSKYNHINALNVPSARYRKSPLLPESVLSDALLFIGINPSFTNGSTIHEDNLKIEFYPIVENSAQTLPYFDKFDKISKYCNNIRWTHLDLFFLRETNQKIIEELSYKNVDFLQEQLVITYEIINRASPRLIVVSNSLASEFFGKLKQKHKSHFKKIWMGFNLDFEKDFDNEIGTYRIKIGNKNTPIIFSSMLSGQRALDIGSFERLMWQIKRIIDLEKC